MSRIKHESFVYKWHKADTSESYIGYHIGHPDDGYICSSPNVKDQIEREEGWEREIVAWGTAREMQAFETGWLRAVQQFNVDEESYLNKWANPFLYTEDGVAEDHKRDFYEGILVSAGVQEGQGKNTSQFYVIYIEDQMINCNPEWVSEKDHKRIQRQLGKRVGCTVTWRGKFAYFSPANLNEVE